MTNLTLLLHVQMKKVFQLQRGFALQTALAIAGCPPAPNFFPTSLVKYKERIKPTT